MDFRQIEAFLNVVRYKGFSNAAEAAFLTQPTISSHVSALEKELGFRLLDRNRRDIRLTAEGRIFYKYAVRMINTREQAVNALRDFSESISGTVSIQASNIPGEHIVPSLIAGFRRIYPDSRFMLEQTDSFTAVNSIRGHKGDIGFTGYMKNDDLVYKLLKKDKLVLITPREDRFIKMEGGRVSMRELITEPFIVREKGSATMESFRKILKAEGIGYSSLSIAAAANSIEAIKQLVRRGTGISVMSGIAAERDDPDRGYCVLDFEDDSAERAFYMIYDDKYIMSPTAEAFRSYVLNIYSEENGRDKR